MNFQEFKKLQNGRITDALKKTIYVCSACFSDLISVEIYIQSLLKNNDAWWHQAIAWSNVGLASVMLCVRENAQDIYNLYMFQN